MKLTEMIRHFLDIDPFVSEHNEKNELQNQQGDAPIAAAAFSVMNILNIREQLFVMLATTGISSIFLVIGYLISK